MISVVIPAHNESAVIGRCLRSITEGFAPGEIEVAVVCNACTDDTAAIARQFAPIVTVVESPIGSKSNALNLGDQAVAGFPRFYIDADIVIDSDAIRTVAKHLASGPALAAAPLIRVDTSRRKWAVKAYYDIWQRLPYCRSGMIGSGIYALSESGRARFDRFPGITADDAFVRLHFEPHERLTVQDCGFTVMPPTTIDKIVHIKTRSHFGNVELRQSVPELWRNEEADHSAGLVSLAANPLNWPALAVYGYVKVRVRQGVRKRLAAGDYKRWERDDTSRQPGDTPPAPRTG